MVYLVSKGLTASVSCYNTTSIANSAASAPASNHHRCLDYPTQQIPPARPAALASKAKSASYTDSAAAF